MHCGDLSPWRHPHFYQTGFEDAAERRTRIVVGLTALMMVAEIAAGTMFNSMALLADGWHMSTHAGALGIAAFAYSFARRHAEDQRFTFGTGKVGALGGFTSAIILCVVALLMIWESASRLKTAQAIAFNEALGVAVAGLAVNVISAVILGGSGHGDNRLSDLHLWQVGPGQWGAIVSIVTHSPRDPDFYKGLLAEVHELRHVTVEVQPCNGDHVG